MPYQIKLAGAPIGYAINTALDGEGAAVQIRGFLCFDDPKVLLSVLESHQASVLAFLPPEARISPDQIRHVAAIIRPDGETTVWLNELSPRGTSLARRPLGAGEPVGREDLADVVRLELGIEIPSSAGFSLVFSVGWERAFFFDYVPLATGTPRDIDIAAVLGGHYTYLLHRRRLALSEEEWRQLTAQEWFPFILLPQNTIDLMFGVLRQGRSVDLLLPEIARAVEEQLDSLPERWSRRPAFEAHRAFLETAIERYKAKDLVSCVSVLYPRIEGVLRAIVKPSGKIGHIRLASMVIEKGKTRLSPLSPLLAERFEQYVTSSFLKDFDPLDPAGLSRHTALHGVADVAEFTQKRALLGFLLMHQILFFDVDGAPEA